MVWAGNKAPEQTTEEGKALASWVEDEFERFSNDQLENLQAVDLRPIFNPPLRPREGMIAYADGTKWDPGQGAGEYFMNAAGLWVPMWKYFTTRDLLTADRTYYVRTDGNDANTGLVNNAGGAFATIAKMLSVAGGVDTGIFQLTCSIQAGTWTTPVVLPRTVGALAPILQGVGSTTIISTTTNPITANGATPWIVKDMKLQTSGGFGVLLQGNSNVTVSGIEFGACSIFHIYVSSGFLNIIGACTITGGAQFFVAADNASVAGVNAALTLTGTPAFTGAFAIALRSAALTFNVQPSGAATGARYLAQLNGVISTPGGGPNYLPGNAAGSTDGFGVYS